MLGCGQQSGEPDPTETNTNKEQTIIDSVEGNSLSNESSGNNSFPDDKVFDIEGAKADNVAIMMPLSSVKETYPEEQWLDVTYETTDESARLRIFDEEQFPLMEVDFDCSQPECPAVMISIIDERFLTEGNFYIGSTWGEIKQFYPNLDYWVDELGAVYLEPAGERHIFVMDLAGVPTDFEELGLESLPDDLEVVEILIM